MFSVVRLATLGCRFLDAPVSGGDIGATIFNGTLAIMCGGDEEAFELALPLLRVMGDKIELFGSSGSGQLALPLLRVMGDKIELFGSRWPIKS